MTTEAWRERIEINPRVLGGKPVIKGTRVPVEVILNGLAAGESTSVICSEYGVTEEDVRAALAYAADIVADEIVVALPPR